MVSIGPVTPPDWRLLTGLPQGSWNTSTELFNSMIFMLHIFSILLILLQVLNFYLSSVWHTAAWKNISKKPSWYIALLLQNATGAHFWMSFKAKTHNQPLPVQKHTPVNCPNDHELLWNLRAERQGHSPLGMAWSPQAEGPKPHAAMSQPFKHRDKGS